MMTYFSLVELAIRNFDRTEQRFVEAIPGVPHQFAQGSEWRLVNDINLEWAEKCLGIALQRPTEDEERLGLAVLFVGHLRGERRPDLFEAGDGLDLPDIDFGP